MSESSPIQWLNSHMEQNGFTQDQLVIYKLGQIESQLANLLVKVGEQAVQFQKEMVEIRLENLELGKRVKNLEEFISTMRNRSIGAAAIVTFLVVSIKVALQWLK